MIIKAFIVFSPGEDNRIPIPCQFELSQGLEKMVENLVEQWHHYRDMENFKVDFAPVGVVLDDEGGVGSIEMRTMQVLDASDMGELFRAMEQAMEDLSPPDDDTIAKN